MFYQIIYLHFTYITGLQGYCEHILIFHTISFTFNYRYNKSFNRAQHKKIFFFVTWTNCENE